MTLCRSLSRQSTLWVDNVKVNCLSRHRVENPRRIDRSTEWSLNQTIAHQLFGDTYSRPVCHKAEPKGRGFLPQGWGGALTILGVMGMCRAKRVCFGNFSLTRGCLLTKFSLNSGCLLAKLSPSRGYIFSNISLSKGCTFPGCRKKHQNNPRILCTQPES